MKCMCGAEMVLIDRWDDADSLAFNIYSCCCGTVARESVWDFPGIIWIANSGAITREHKPTNEVLALRAKLERAEAEVARMTAGLDREREKIRDYYQDFHRAAMRANGGSDE